MVLTVLLELKTVVILLMYVQVRDDNCFTTMYLHTLNIYIAKRIPIYNYSLYYSLLLVIAD